MVFAAAAFFNLTQIYTAQEGLSDVQAKAILNCVLRD